MRTFKFKKIVTGISLLSMIFSSGFSVNAMDIGAQFNIKAREDYRNNSCYYALNKNDKIALDQLHSMILLSYRSCNNNNSRDNFREILHHISVFLKTYNDKPGPKQLIIRVIGISNFENGYIVSGHLFSKFLARSKSCINSNFGKLGLNYERVDKKHLQQIIGQIDCAKFNQWTLRLPNQQSVHSNPQNVPPLVNINDSQNNIAISNPPNVDLSPLCNSLMSTNDNQDEFNDLSNENPFIIFPDFY